MELTSKVRKNRSGMLHNERKEKLNHEALQKNKSHEGNRNWDW